MNTTITEFLADDKFIIAFLVGCLLIGTIGNEKILYWFLLLVLFSMVILNSKKFIAMLALFNIRGSSGGTITTQKGSIFGG